MIDAHKLLALSLILVCSMNLQAGTREQAKRLHERLAGVPPTEAVLDSMTADINANDALSAALTALDNPQFYNVVLKNFVAPWTNEAGTVFVPLNDYSATVIGMVRDDIDFREVLSGDILYVGNSALNLPNYSMSNNDHYQALEDNRINLQDELVQVTQSSVTGLPSDATAGVMTSRAAAQAFFSGGTNRAMFRFTLMNHMCTDLEPLKDISLPPDRIRQDVSRSPGGDSRIFSNNCIGCHSGMDPMAQAFAYYEFNYDPNTDPNGDAGFMSYNDVGQTDPQSGTRVTNKHLINPDNFNPGFIINDDKWDNYWRIGPNANLGWSNALPGSGNGAKSLGQEFANSDTYADCQVKKVFKQVCYRDPVNAADRNQVAQMVASFQSNNYRLKQVFAEAALYCVGD